MPTILLQEIRDLLTAFLTAINTKIEQMLVTLNAVKDDADAIKENTDSLPDIKDNTDVLPGMAQSVDDTLFEVQQIKSKVDTANSTLGDIEDNTGAIVTPIVQIKNNTDSIKNDVATVKGNTTSIANNMNTVATNSGSTASFAEEIATNTLNTYDKVVTIASDTTQMRADNANIIAILNNIYDLLNNRL